MDMSHLIRATPRTPETERAAWTGRAELAALTGNQAARAVRRRLTKGD